jgi:hypothetical protein
MVVDGHGMDNLHAFFLGNNLQMNVFKKELFAGPATAILYGLALRWAGFPFFSRKETFP